MRSNLRLMSFLSCLVQPTLIDEVDGLCVALNTSQSLHLLLSFYERWCGSASLRETSLLLSKAREHVCRPFLAKKEKAAVDRKNSSEWELLFLSPMLSFLAVVSRTSVQFRGVRQQLPSLSLLSSTLPFLSPSPFPSLLLTLHLPSLSYLLSRSSKVHKCTRTATTQLWLTETKGTAV